MNDLSIAVQTVNSEARVDSREMAERLDNKHKSVMELIGRNEAHFEGFGTVAYETETVQNSAGAVNKTRFALLNEDQCFFLLTLVRNSKKVVLLKAALVMAFRTVREIAAAPVLPAPAPAFYIPATYGAALMLAGELAGKNEALEAQALLDAPKLASHAVLISSEGLYGWLQASKMLGIGRTTLCARLREDRVLMTAQGGRGMHNVPYQSYIDRGYFEVKARIANLDDGREVTTHTTYVTGAGLDYLRRHLKKEAAPRAERVLGFGAQA